MSLEKDKMIEALNQKVIFELRKLNFKGTFPHFRRISDGKLNVITFQFDKYGGGFVINIANCRPDGYTTPWGKEIRPNKLTVYDLPKRHRIKPNLSSTDSTTDSWYRYDMISLNEFINIYESICEDVLSDLEFAKSYWENGESN
jgi:hypothetical protein